MVVIESYFKNTSNNIYKIDSNNEHSAIIKDSLEWEYLLKQFKGHELKSYITRGLIRQSGNTKSLSMSDIYPDENLLWPTPFPWRFYGFIEDHISRTVDNYELSPEEYVERWDNLHITNDTLPKFTEIKKELVVCAEYDSDDCKNITNFLKLLYIDYAKQNRVKFYLYDPNIYPPRDRV